MTPPQQPPDLVVALHAHIHQAIDSLEAQDGRTHGSSMARTYADQVKYWLGAHQRERQRADRATPAEQGQSLQGQPQGG